MTSEATNGGDPMGWRSGIEGQRRADLGDGTYRNPVLAGDHPDPSILRDGDVYYKVSSSFDYYPGLLVWRSPDLVNWTPVGPVLTKVIGSVLAPDLTKVGDRYFIYLPVLNVDMAQPDAPRPYGPDLPMITNYVIHAEAIEGPWSEPIDLGVAVIDPGHAVGEDGTRYLFLADGKRVRLRDDGLATDGEIETVYAGWPIPADWVVEGQALEGPKLMRRDEWFYIFAAQGGTAGPPTSHMIVVARSRSLDGPWENAPHNPLLHTARADEPWWSRGHGTPVEGPDGRWWIVHHGYENGLRTLGRQMLLEPMAWTDDGWPVARGGDLSRPLPMPAAGAAPAHGMALSDDFTLDRLGTAFAVYRPAPDYRDTVRVSDGALHLDARGTSPQEATLVALNPGDRRYCVSTVLDLQDGATGGLLLFYNGRAFCGLACAADRVRVYRIGQEQLFTPGGDAVGARVHLRVVNDDNVATFFLSGDGEAWRKVVSFEVAGYNHNVFDGFLSLRPGVFAMDTGQVRCRRISYQAGRP
ncbi:hypothetical protein XB05_08660 [Xanthomonas arboricola]|nr:hypothetical protein XB05_08660 [Xanthomonas arboricola]